jgi:hypothetical protein
MKGMNMIRVAGSLMAISLLTAAGCSGGGYETGAAVIAEWSPNSYYEGTVGGTCEGGYNVKWNDGSADKCVEASKVVSNKPATKEDVKVGSTVFAKWSMSYWMATVTAVSGDTYSVEYTADKTKKDGLTLADLKLR